MGDVSILRVPGLGRDEKTPYLGFPGKSDSGITNKYNPAKDADVTMDLTIRSGLTLSDSKGNPASILPAHLSITKTQHKVFIADNGALDIGSQDFTICNWLRNDGNHSAYNYYCGKLVFGNLNGSYSIMSYITSGILHALVATSGGLVNITSTVQATSGTWIHSRLVVKQSTKTISWFLNHVQVGSDVPFTGTIASLANSFEFVLGAINAANGLSFTDSCLSSHSDIYIFHRLLTDAEALTIYNRGVVTGAAAHWPLLGASGTLSTVVKNEYDASGNGLHLTTDSVSGHEILVSDYKFHANGSRHGLDVGYTLYENGTNQIYVPYSDAGAELSNPPGLTGYTRIDNFPGSSGTHNLANSDVGFVGSEFDRSNTTIWSSLARAASTYYNSSSSTTKKYWHIIELSNLTFQNWANPGHENKIYVKITDNSYGRRRTLNEIISVSTNKSVADRDKVLKAFNDVNLTRVKTVNLSTTQGATPAASAIGLIINSGKHVWISFGDGYIQKYTANDAYTAISHTHTTGNTEYAIRLLGDLDGVKKIVIADTLMNVDIGEFGKLTTIEWIGSGVTRTNYGNLDLIPDTLQEIWFRYPTIDGPGITGNLSLKRQLRAFEMQGGTTAAQKWVKNVIGRFQDIVKIRDFCAVTKVNGSIDPCDDIEYFSWADYYEQEEITGDISNKINLYSFETQKGSEGITGDTTLLVNMEQLKTTPAMTKPSTLNHMPKLCKFSTTWELSEAEVNQYITDIDNNKEVVRTHYLNTPGSANGVGFRYVDLSGNPNSAAPTNAAALLVETLRETVSPAVPGTGDKWTILVNELTLPNGAIVTNLTKKPQKTLSGKYVVTVGSTAENE